MFEESDVIYAYTRAQAIADGEQIKLDDSADLVVLCREHYKYPIYFTSAVWETVKTAVNNPKYCNDWEGVVHDVLWMSRRMGKPVSDQITEFVVIIQGAGRKTNYRMWISCGPTDIDDPAPCLTVMFPEEY